MEGRGVVNYDVSKPSYSFSAQTTQFDDELIRRGIVTFEEAMMRKGASAEEASRLKELKEESQSCSFEKRKDSATKTVDDDDDDFMSLFRARRLEELKAKEAGPHFGEIFSISRPEWAHQVNEASHGSWVVVTLTSSNSELTGCVEAAVASLAKDYSYTKFVVIPSRSAIPNWPDDQLPTIFLYRHGKMQHQLTQLPREISTEQLQDILDSLNVFISGEIDARGQDEYDNVD
jgi:hypothetical protein